MTSTTLRHCSFSIIAIALLALPSATRVAAQRVADLSSGARIKLVAPEAADSSDPVRSAPDQQ